jgi:hypothetical protein
MTELKIEWKDFLGEISSLEKEVDLLFSLNPRGKEEIQKFVADYNLWREKVIVFLDKSFGKNNIYSREFKYSNQNKFNFSGQQENTQINLREIKQDLKNDVLYLEYNRKILKVSDLITKPNKADLSQRENYTTEDILELILEKLYELYDDNVYAILPILEGNGIKLKRRREEFEYVRLLEDNGYVQSNNIGKQADAQLTVNGKLYIEDKRKRIEPDYNSISDDKESIYLKFEEISKKLQELGFGQEIIFNELDEMRELYPTLNKKNWGQLVKGKIVDLGLSQVINVDVMKMIYEHITNDILRIP